ncbi:MAG: tRNA (guanosine(37)-N1)-methyltransferase TrmD [Lachnospiraceae bacterium]|nr:tRNA (guanosine(37)-N1)-methyltransferase TrmD [Lachnospiraceae bacterium]
MNFHVMTLFPEMIENAMKVSITGRAIDNNLLSLNTYDIRDYTLDKHRRVDDYPYGGGAGMLMMAEPVSRCYEAITNKINKKPRTIFLSPTGKVFNQKICEDLAKEEDLIFLCGHYEGIDERVLEEIVTDTISIGDYVLTGGELPALVMMDSISRLIDGVLSNNVSASDESHSSGLLEHPQYTRPAIWHEKEVPPVLLSGNHKLLSEWYRKESLRKTLINRPDMLENIDLSELDKKYIEEIKEELES